MHQRWLISIDCRSLISLSNENKVFWVVKNSPFLGRILSGLRAKCFLCQLSIATRHLQPKGLFCLCLTFCLKASYNKLNKRQKFFMFSSLTACVLETKPSKTLPNFLPPSVMLVALNLITSMNTKLVFKLTYRLFLCFFALEIVRIFVEND